MKLKKLTQCLAAGALLLVAGATSVWAEGGGDDTRSLIDMLVKKGILTNQEAADVAAKIRKDTDSNSGYKIKVGSWIKELSLFGDARLRYEYREGQTGVLAGVNTTGGDTFSRERWRYRLRVGALTKFTDDWSMGLRLETSTNNRSTNVTFADDGGPWNKTSDGVFVGQLYMNWDAADWATLTGGRMPNPLMTTSMVWDADINPEGASEKFKYSINDKLELFATLNQFLYENQTSNNVLGTGPNKANYFMFANQVGAKYSFDKDTVLTLAPTLYVYTGYGASFGTAATPNFAGSTAANSTQLNDLQIVEVPLEFKWKMMELPWKFWTDFAMNTEGGSRARLAGDPGHREDKYAYQIGLGVGSTKKKGDWEAKAFWEHKELYALDPNLTDSDIFDSRLNVEGVALSVGYAFTDFLTGSITYARGDRITRELASVAPGDLTGVNPLNDYQLLQLDLSLRF